MKKPAKRSKKYWQIYRDSPYIAKPHITLASPFNGGAAWWGAISGHTHPFNADAKVYVRFLDGKSEQRPLKRSKRWIGVASLRRLQLEKPHIYLNIYPKKGVTAMYSSDPVKDQKTIDYCDTMNNEGAEE